MCGINGIITRHPIENKKELVHRMNESIRHRGPDNEGIYEDGNCAVGMRRLSVIDLDTGSQPLFNREKNRLIVYNGEIYNYRELREELMREGCFFATRSDTEVILNGIERHGKEFIRRLEGMYAFCLYDKEKKKWLFARDRAGEKPLYYYQDQRCFLFASELKSLLTTGLISREIDEEALSIYFQLGYIPAPHCIIAGIKKLPAASLMELDESGGVEITPYWHLPTGIKEEESRADQPGVSCEVYENYDRAKTVLRQTLTKSVERRMISDVPLGAFLSGGFDSSIIVGLMSRMKENPVDTFTIGFREKEYDESSLAELVSKKNGTRHHTLFLDWEEAEKQLDHLLGNMDEPFADPSLVASYMVSKKTREYVTVALTGDAGDELFAGYNKYLMAYYGKRYEKLPSFLRKGMIEPLSERLPDRSSLKRKIRKVTGNAYLSLSEQTKRLLCRGFSPEESKRLLPGTICDPLDFVDKLLQEPVDADDQKRIQYVDYHIVLEGQMLPKVDRSSMLCSLETRVPMLDHHVTELAFCLPSEFKIKDKKRKRILKDAFSDLLPEELFHAPKHGFDVPVGRWLCGSLKTELDKYTSVDYLKKQGLLDFGALQELLRTPHPDDLVWATKSWAVFVFQRWWERVMS